MTTFMTTRPTMRATARATTLAATLALAALAGAAPAVDAQDRRTDETFQWREPIQAGSWLRIRNLNGRISVTQAAGTEAEIVARKRWSRGNPEDVRVELTRSSDGVLVCALWHEDAECDEDGYRSRNGDGNRRTGDVAVDFEVRLPRGVRLLASTVNGAVEVEGATSEVRASSVNGRVEAVSTGGPVKARTVNGNIRARMGAVPPGEDLEYQTVNGSIVIEVPENFSADLEMQTVNGSLRTDFPLQISGRLNPRRVRATIGEGGRRLRLQTVNGSVELRKR